VTAIALATAASVRSKSGASGACIATFRRPRSASCARLLSATAWSTAAVGDVTRSDGLEHPRGADDKANDQHGENKLPQNETSRYRLFGKRILSLDR